MITGEWDNEEDIRKDFEIGDDAFDTIIYAEYECGSWEGEAFVIFTKNGKMYEVNASHCSCYGLEDQWDPEEITIEDIKFRAKSDDYETKYKRALKGYKEHLIIQVAGIETKTH